MRWVLSVLLLLGVALAFECPSDTIFRLATNHREKDVEAECHREKTNIKCEEQSNVDKLWSEYETLQREYKVLVNDCVKQRTLGARVRRHDHDPSDPNIDHTGHQHRRRRHGDHDPNDPNIDHTGHQHRKRREHDHDPNDPNVDHTGHQHRRRRDHDHEAAAPNFEHQHKKRRHANVETAPYSEPEKQQFSRSRRQVCKTKASENLTKLHNEFKEFCDRENICLPDEDLPAGPKRDKFKDIQNQRAKKYSSYLLEVASCNAT